MSLERYRGDDDRRHCFPAQQLSAAEAAIRSQATTAHGSPGLVRFGAASVAGQSSLCDAVLARCSSLYQHIIAAISALRWRETKRRR